MNSNSTFTWVFGYSTLLWCKQTFAYLHIQALILSAVLLLASWWLSEGE